MSFVNVAKACALRVHRAVELPRKGSHDGVEKSAHDPAQRVETTEKMHPDQRFIFSVAPMMDWTDRHCRAFHRLLTRRARLYTEMVTADAVMSGPRERLLGFDPSEHPVALQLGGAEPGRLAEAARIGADFGYDEINLNCGCPSDRVQSGRFGACLMREPALVAECIAAMRAAVAIPVTRQVPHRRRRAGAARGAVRASSAAVSGGRRGGADRACAQGLARGPQPEGQSQRPAARLSAWSMR